MYMNRFLQMSFSQMMFDMISDIYDQFSRSLITFIVLLALALSLSTCFTPYTRYLWKIRLNSFYYAGFFT